MQGISKTTARNNMRKGQSQKSIKNELYYVQLPVFSNT